jgi:hypothetical protein
VRNKYVHGYGVILSALGLLGRYLLQNSSDGYENLLQRLKGIDWSKWQVRKDGTIQTSEHGKRIGNPSWNGFAMNGSVVQNTTTNIRHTAMLFRKILGLEISEDEELELKLLRSGKAE